MHCIFLYTLQTKHMPFPTAVTQLVESTGRHSCSEYFFLHLIQDIMDVTTISNKTFEEAILIIHSLIDQMIDKRMCTNIHALKYFSTRPMYLNKFKFVPQGPLDRDTYHIKIYRHNIT